MTAERWLRLDALFHQATALPPAERSSWLDAACADDAGLRAEVERLVAAHLRTGTFIDSPAVVSVGPWLPVPAEAAAGRRFGAYRIVREIGRGGMGAVYLAERADGQYEQRVALKLIKRGMDTGLVLGRFRAERQILAKLEHANIARLLDAGTSDDGQPYFVMEYVQGEPIDRYSEARGLSIDARLHLFLQVCDAVAYAHRHHIIHRDIKPVNVLVTPAGVPKLLDFGIAKVLEPGPAEPSSTASLTGLRLLTPEYASPEQVEGRGATAASDVYSLGVILYELLTGRSPYEPRSRDPFDVADAVRTTDPKRPSAAVLGSDDDGARVLRRPALPRDLQTPGSTTGLSRQLRGDLDTIVLTAIRRETDRRYASVERLADDIRRYLDKRPITARPDTVAYRAVKFMRRNRAAVVAALAGAAAVAAAGLLAVNAAGSDPETRSLIAAGALGARDRIVVADFADRIGDPALAAAVTDAFRVDLSQSPLVQVLTPAQVRAALGRMHAPADAVDDSLAREVAVREGAAAIVTGAIARVGPAFTISVQLVSADKGAALAGARGTAADSTQLIAAVDRASKTLRRGIGESVRDLEDMPSLEQVTTASLAALRKYTTGYRLFLEGGDRHRALALYQEAIAIDTAFAAAHLAIAFAWGALSEFGRSYAAGERALAHRDRLPFFERQFLIAAHAYGSGEYRMAIEAYRSLLESYPTDVPALNNLALAYQATRDFGEAERLWQRAAALDSSISALLYGVHASQAFQGRFADSRRTLDLIARRFPDDPVRLIVEVQDAAARQAWDEAEQRAAANVALWSQDTLKLVDAYESLAAIVMTRGRLAEAERLWREQLRVSTAAASHGRHLFGALQLAYLHLHTGRTPADTRAAVDSVLAARPLESILPGDRPYDELARFYAAAGDLPRARALLAGAHDNDRALGRNRPADRSWTRGVIALAEGSAAHALADLRHAGDTHPCPICVLPDLARAYQADGDHDAAIAAYERYIATPWLWRFEIDAVELGPALIRLGELYEQQGDRTKAAAAYSRLLRLWHRADGAARVESQNVRRRIAQLQAG